MHIAVDAMGGDFAPAAVVEGAWQAAREDGTQVLLVGDRAAVEAELARLGGDSGGIEIVEAEQVVGMDEPATTPIRRKRRASVRVCAELVKEGRAAGMVTAGNTGAAMISAKLVIGTVPGVDRPALAAMLPSPTGRTVVLDVGANIDSKAAHLRQFAVMGHFYAQQVLKQESPRVGLLSIGEEEGKGTDLTREVFGEMAALGFNFIGNVEGREVFSGEVDVVVCDGFVGNVLIKSAESLAEWISGMVVEELGRSARTRLGALLARPALEGIRRKTDYREYGAAPLLGLEGGCFIAHGSSNAKAVRSAIRRAVEFCSAEVHEAIRVNVVELHAREERLRQQRDGAVESREVKAS